MKNFKEALLYKKWFLWAVFILLINDFFLKYQFHNFLTGKISDFAGLFAFSYFLSLFTKKIKSAYYFTFVFFIFWKTEASQPFINFLNTLNLNIYRVIDYSDFIAFLILPISYRYRKEGIIQHFNRSLIKSTSIAIITCFSFIATTQIRERIPYVQEQLNIKSDFIIDFPFNENVFFDSLGYKYYKPQCINEGHYIYVKQKHFDSLSILYKIKILKSEDSLSQIKIDSILNFHYIIYPYKNKTDSITKTQLIARYKKMTSKQFDSIFLTNFEKTK